MRVSFLVYLTELNIQVFTVCKTLFILNWTKSECPNFSFKRNGSSVLLESRDWAWKDRFWSHSILEACDHFAYEIVRFLCLLYKFYPNNHNYCVSNLYMPLPQTETWKVMQLPNLCKNTTLFLEFLSAAYIMGRSNHIDLL